MRPVYVRGMGLWRPGYPDVACWCDGKIDESEARPAAALLAGPLMRRASALTRMAVEVFGQATCQARADVETVGSVYAIIHGEIVTAVALLEMMQTGDGKLSPTKFHNSVYNTASGYASIACSNRAPSTTLSGGSEIVGSALLEAIGMLADGIPEVVVVWADEPPPPPFDTGAVGAPLALALCLSHDGRDALAQLTNLRREPRGPEAGDADGELYTLAALRLVEAIGRRRPGRVAIELANADAKRLWAIDVSFDAA